MTFSDLMKNACLLMAEVRGRTKDLRSMGEGMQWREGMRRGEGMQWGEWL